MPVTRTRNIPNCRKAKPQLQLVGGSDSSLVRLAKVRAAQKRIASGYYDRDAVRDRLAVALLEEIGKD